jgi:hypothetical protein
MTRFDFRSDPSDLVDPIVLRTTVICLQFASPKIEEQNIIKPSDNSVPKQVVILFMHVGQVSG